MTVEKISLIFSLRNIDKRKNYYLKEIHQNILISKKHRIVCTTLNNIEHYAILASGASEGISMFAFASLLASCIGSTSSALGLNFVQ